MNSTSPTYPHRDAYRGVVLVLTASATVGAVMFASGGLALGDAVLLQAAVSLALSAGVVAGVAIAQNKRAAALGPDPEPEPAVAGDIGGTGDIGVREETTGNLVSGTAPTQTARIPSRLSRVRRMVRVPARLRDLRAAGRAAQTRAPAVLVALTMLGTIAAWAASRVPWYVPETSTAVLGVIVCLTGCGLAATAVRYLSQVDSQDLPESAALSRGGRLVIWVCGLAAASVAVQWLAPKRSSTFLAAFSLAIMAVNAAVCCSLLMRGSEPGEKRLPFFDADFAVTRILGSRANILASIMDSAHAQLGIDLRSTWALAVIRRSLEPLLMCLALIGWLATALTVVGIDEQGLVERLGVAVGGEPLSPGLHVHWPWPIDRVIRIPVQRVQALAVGHEGEKVGGPENVLWASEHAPNEYTLLLGNGRDLVTIDATVQFRIRDPRAWQYASQNPGDALRAIAYRAVMRTTVDHTLAGVLSENLVAITSRMRGMVQADADELGIGVLVLDFTIGGMHPPVPVAPDYQAVVSAELGKVTAVAGAQATRNRTVPYAESEVVIGANTARAEGAEALAKAAGEAWSFRTLEAQYRASPNEYFFRERLDALERVLSVRAFTIVDSRILRDQGELWITP